jgi:hypothetical protein
MSKPRWIWLLGVSLIVVLLVLPTAPSQAWSHHSGGRVFIGVGVWPGFWWGPPYPWYWYPPYYSPPSYYPPAPVIVQQPQTYIQQAPAPQAAVTYWYYCPSAKGYYPEIPNCSESWIPVAPRRP